jgi:hypothetical protein
MNMKVAGGHRDCSGRTRGAKQRPVLNRHQKQKAAARPQHAKSGNPLMRNFTGRLSSNEVAAAMASEANVRVALRAFARLTGPPIRLSDASNDSLNTFRLDS